MVELIETTKIMYDNKHCNGSAVYRVDRSEWLPEEINAPRKCLRCGDMFVPEENLFREHCKPCLEGIKI